MMDSFCNDHKAIKQCAILAKKMAHNNEKKKISWYAFTFIISGLAAMGLLLFYIATSQCSAVSVKAIENSRLFHRIDKNISVIAAHIGCQDKLTEGH